MVSYIDSKKWTARDILESHILNLFFWEGGLVVVVVVVGVVVLAVVVFIYSLIYLFIYSFYYVISFILFLK